MELQMGKAKFNPVGTKPKRSGVYRVRQSATKLWDEAEGGIMEGYAWFDAMLKRWGGIRPGAKEARDSSDTCAARYQAGQDKEWARV
jgi:hypothetical protein